MDFCGDQPDQEGFKIHVLLYSQRRNSMDCWEFWPKRVFFGQSICFKWLVCCARRSYKGIQDRKHDARWIHNFMYTMITEPLLFSPDTSMERLEWMQLLQNTNTTRIIMRCQRRRLRYVSNRNRKGGVRFTRLIALIWFRSLKYVLCFCSTSCPMARLGRVVPMHGFLWPGAQNEGSFLLWPGIWKQSSLLWKLHRSRGV